MSKHTPGPWEFIPFIRGHKWAIGPDVFQRACDAYSEADARLIAAAPDLLRELRNLELGANTADACYSRNPGNFAAALRDLREYAEAARATIAKAIGEEP